MELHIIRHGRTIGNQSGVLQGWTDSPLLPSEAASLQSVSFDSSRYDAIFSSDLGRCLETCSALRLSGEILDQRLRERHFGILENRPLTQYREEFPDEFSQFQRFNGDYVIPSGESRSQHFKRIVSWIQEAQTFALVLAVTHGGTLDFLYRLATGLDLHGGEEIFHGANASISRFRLDWPEVALITFSVPLYA